MTRRITTHEDYLFSSADHQTIAHELETSIFNSGRTPSQFIESRIRHEVVSYEEDQITALTDMAEDLFDKKPEQDMFFSGAVIGLSVLDKVADRLDVDRRQHRLNWVLLHYRQSQLKHLKDIDQEYDKTEEYHQLILKLVENLAKTQEERDAFFIGFALLVRTGRESIVRMKLVSAVQRADEIIEATNVAAELRAILSQE